ncbi:MAG: cytochrome c [Gammaproteobacteria bacterium]|jgi:cytochrome c556|nr:cytochrome c [Gammaproteobacteria bacterium]MBT4495042.1 cytochrome c [Gammaproteobacteria bacterium]
MRDLLYVFLFVLVSTPAAMADGQIEAEYRQSVMKSIGGHMSSMVTILKNQVHIQDLSLHAQGIAALADVAPKVFPEGSDIKKSRALPDIWEDRAAFDEAMNRFVSAAKEMPGAAASGEMSQIGPALSKLGKTCKGCHDNYKSE